MAIVDMQAQDIAPCGVNCRACSSFLTSHNPCPGCRAPEEAIQRSSCLTCKKRICAEKQGVNWCFECEKFPCSLLREFSKHYQRNYHVNLIENGQRAKENMESFLESQVERFTCKSCGGTIDQHNRCCSLCKAEDLI